MRSQNVYDEKLELGDVVYISDEIDSEMRTSRVLPGDVLLNITGASLGRTYRVPLDFPLANVNQHVCILRFGDTAGFAAWMMKSTLMKAQIAFCQSGAAREGLNFEEIRALFFPLPPLPEQNAIAAFLDLQCTQIESLIEKKQRLLELLDKKRSAVITQAVTRGLDPTVPMKDSGVDWLGQVPEGWKVKRLKFGVDNINQKCLEEAPTAPFVALEHIESWTGNLMIDENSQSDGQPNCYRPGDVLFCKLRPYLAKVHLAKANGTCTSELLVLRAQHDIFPKYLHRFLLSRDTIDCITASTYGAKMPRANWEFIGNLPLPIPPLPEQQAIADYLDAQCAAMDCQRINMEKSIELLREYRASIITHAVTGKIDVRDVAPLQ